MDLSNLRPADGLSTADTSEEAVGHGLLKW